MDISWEIKRKIPSSQLASYIFNEHKGDETEHNPVFERFYWHDIAKIMLVYAEKYCRFCEGCVFSVNAGICPSSGHNTLVF